MYRKVEKILPTLQKYIKETPLEKYSSFRKIQF